VVAWQFSFPDFLTNMMMVQKAGYFFVLMKIDYFYLSETKRFSSCNLQVFNVKEI